jgi:hypothetical protein
MDTTFERNFLAMTAAIQQDKAYSRKVKSLLKPSHEIELQAHEKAAADGHPCGCRVCYWARKL